MARRQLTDQGKSYTQIIYPRRDSHTDYIKPVKVSNIKTTYQKMNRKFDFSKEDIQLDRVTVELTNQKFKANVIQLKFITLFI